MESLSGHSAGLPKPMERHLPKGILNTRGRLLALLVVLGLLPVSYFVDGALILGGDTAYPLDIGKSFYKSLFVWSQLGGVGFTNAINLLVIWPYFTILYVLQWVGIGPVATQAVFLAGLNICTGLAMFFCASNFYRGKNRQFVGLVSALVYLYNPYSMLNWSNPDPITLMAYAMYPFLLGAFVKGLGSSSPVRAGLLFSLLSLAVTTGYLNIPFLVLLVLTMGLYLFWHLFFEGAWKDQKAKIFRFLCSVVTASLLIHSYWIVPMAVSAWERLAHFQERGGMQWVDTFSAYSTFVHLLGLRGYSGWEAVTDGRAAFSYAQTLTHHPLMALTAFLPILLAASTLLYRRRISSRTLFLFVLLSGVLFLARGSRPPLAEINIWFYENIPGFMMFSSAYIKFGLVMAFCSALLAAIGLEELREYLTRARLARYSRLSVRVFLVAWAVYIFPFWTGDVLVNGNDQMPSFLHRQVPTYYYELAEWINQQSGDFKVLSLPQQNTWTSYSWGYVGVNILTTLLEKPLIDSQLSRGTEIYRAADHIYQNVGRDFNQDMVPLLSSLGVRYLLVHNDIDPKSLGITPLEVGDFLRDQPSIQLVRSFGQVDVYEVSEQSQLPRLYATNAAQIVFGRSQDMTILNTAGLLGNRGLPQIFTVNQKRAGDPGSFTEAFKGKQSFSRAVVLGGEGVGESIFQAIDRKWRYMAKEERIEATINEEGPYAIIVKAHPDGALQMLKVIISGPELISPSNVGFLSSIFSYPELRYFGKIQLEEGRHELRFTSPKEIIVEEDKKPSRPEPIVAEVAVVPLSVLETTTNYILDLLRSAQQRTYLFSEIGGHGNRPLPFYLPREDSYSLRVHVDPRVVGSKVRMESGKRDWQEELDRWSFYGEEFSSQSEFTSLATTLPPLVVFGDNWHSWDHDRYGAGRWGTNNMKLILINLGNRAWEGILRMRVSSILERDLQITVNGVLHHDLRVPAHYRRTIRSWANLFLRLLGSPLIPQYETEGDDMELVLDKVRLLPGKNEVELFTPQGAPLLGALLMNGDSRRGSLRLREVPEFILIRPLDEEKIRRPLVLPTRSTVEVTDGILKLSVLFGTGKFEQRFVVMGRDYTEGINLKEFPYFNLQYRVADRFGGEVTVFFGIDDNADNKIDRYLTLSQCLEHPEDPQLEQFSQEWITWKGHVFAEARKQLGDRYFEEQLEPHVLRLVFVVHPLLGPERQHVFGEQGFKFEFGDFEFFSRSAILWPIAVNPLKWDPIGDWVIQSENCTFERHVTDDGTLLVNAHFDRRLLGVKEEARRPAATLTFFMKSGQRLTGEMVSEDGVSITLAKVRELGGARATLQKSDVSYTFGADTLVPEIEPELVRFSRIMESRDFVENPFLRMSYELEDERIQNVAVYLGIDDDGDGTTDHYIVTGQRRKLDEWEFVGSYGKIDLYRVTLPSDFPKSVTTQPSKSLQKAYLLHQEKSVAPTWERWSFDEERFQIKSGTITVSTPADVVPEDYAIIWPVFEPSFFYPKSSDFEIHVPDYLRAAGVRPDQLKEVQIRFARNQDAKISKKSSGMYGFKVWDIGLYNKIAYNEKNLSPITLQPFYDRLNLRIGGALIKFKPEEEVRVLEKGGVWIEAEPMVLAAGFHQPGFEIQVHPSFVLDVVELSESFSQRPERLLDLAFKKISPSQYRAQLDTEGSCWLVFSDSFNKGWNAYVETGSPSQALKWSLFPTGRKIRTKFVVNGYANGWYLPQASQAIVILEYFPQKFFWIFGLVSLVSTTIVLFQVVLSYRVANHRAHRTSAVAKESDSP